MFKHLPTLSALALIALTAPGWAQQSETQAVKPQTEAAPETGSDTASEQPEAPKGEEQLDFGAPADGAPEVGQRYSKQKIEDWDLACIKLEEGEDPCSLLQILKDKNDNPIAEFSLFRIKNATQAVAGATIIVPLETLLPAQLTISVDGAAGKRYNYSFCNPIGCVAQIGLTEADVATFKRGKVATLALRPAPAPEQLIELEMSLKGFTAGYDIVDVVEN